MKETHDFAKINLCFVFSCVEMPTGISDKRLAVLVNIKISFQLLNTSVLKTFFIILPFKEIGLSIYF